MLCGHRNEVEQNEAFDNGRSDLQWPDSNHNTNPSRAIDVAVYHADKDPHINWADTRGFYHFGGYVQGVAREMGIGLRWGGDWDNDRDLGDQQLFDLVHFELVNV